MARDTRKPTPVGFLIDAQRIILAQARARAGGVEIEAQGAIETPAGAISGAQVLDAARVGQAIRALCRRAGISSRAATATLLAPNYSMRALRVPSAPERERRTLVRGELEQAQALPVGGGALDFLWMSPPATAPQGTPADVYAYYVNDTVVSGLSDAFTAAGMELAGVEPGSVAMMRTYLAFQGERQPAALVCPAAKHTDLCIHDGTRVRQLRRIPAGWEDITQNLASPGTRDALPNLGAWTPPAAAAATEGALENFAQLFQPGESFEKIELAGWPDPDLSPEANQPAGPPPMRERPRTQDGPAADGGQGTPKADFLAAEVSRTLAFFNRENAEELHPRSVVILAPARVAGDFATVLTEALDIPVTPFSLQGVVEVSGDDEGDAGALLDGFLPAVGAALAGSGADLGMPRVDVSRQDHVARARRTSPRVVRAGMAGSTLWLAASATAAVILSVLQGGADGQIVQLGSDIERIKRERAPIIRYHQLSVAARAQEQQVQVPADSVLGRVAASTTPGVALTRMGVNPDGSVVVEGQAVGTANVKSFALRLGRGESVKLPVIEYTKKENGGLLSFRIIATFREPVPPAPAQSGKER